MTEFNLFCYSEKYNDENSFQQKRYRVFNKEVSNERYYEIKEIVDGMLKNDNKLKLSDFWKKVTQDQWQQLLAIPEASDFKEGFEYISGQKILDKVNTTITFADGRSVELSEESYGKLREISR